MSHFLTSGDNGTTAGHAGIVFGFTESQRYAMPSKPCAWCGHVVRHPDPEELRELALAHAKDVHGFEVPE